MTQKPVTISLELTNPNALSSLIFVRDLFERSELPPDPSSVNQEETVKILRTLIEAFGGKPKDRDPNLPYSNYVRSLGNQFTVLNVPD